VDVSLLCANHGDGKGQVEDPEVGAHSSMVVSSSNDESAALPDVMDGMKPMEDGCSIEQEAAIFCHVRATAGLGKQTHNTR